MASNEEKDTCGHRPQTIEGRPLARPKAAALRADFFQNKVLFEGEAHEKRSFFTI